MRSPEKNQEAEKRRGKSGAEKRFSAGRQTMNESKCIDWRMIFSADKINHALEYFVYFKRD